MIIGKARSEKPKKIVLAGAESTGKTTLAEALAKHYNSAWVPEIARGYIEDLDRHYTYEDVIEIARLQIESENLIASGTSYVFIDEWLINTKVWLLTVYGECPQWIEDHIKKCTIDLFLLCDVDMPWVYDPIRENGGETRFLLHDKYKRLYEENGLNYLIVRGLNEARIENAIKLVDGFFK